MVDVTRRAVDPETGYISINSAFDDEKQFGPEVRCRRCGGRGMWHRGDEFDTETILCLKCADEWFGPVARALFNKHGWRDMRSSPKKWMAAFNEFCQTKPKEIDIASHNRQIQSDDALIKGLFPQYFS